MARIELDDKNWTDLSTGLTEGTTYWLQSNSSRNMEAENIYLALSATEPDDALDGVLGHDFKIKFTDGLYVRSQTGATSIKIEEVA